MVNERLNPLNDYLFLRMMGEQGDEEQLLAFLNAVLRRTEENRLKSVKIREDRILTAKIIGDKASVLDVRAETSDGTKIDIEVQLRNVGDMDRRSLFYWSREYAEGIIAGQEYLELPKVIAINIVNFEFIPAKDFHTCFHLWEDADRDLLLTDALEIHFVDMVKFRRLRDKDIRNNSLHRWLAYFDRSSPEDLVKEAIKMDRAIQKAQERADFVSQDKESLHAYQMREMALSDWASGIGHARREGRLEGRLEGKLEDARAMKADNIPVSQIRKYTGLTEQQIKDL